MSEGSIEDLEGSSDETKYNNFAATSTTNYMTTSRNRYPTEVSSSDSSSMAQPQPNAWASIAGDEGAKNGNGQAGGVPKDSLHLLRARKVIIARQKKRIAMLEKESERYKALLLQIYRDGILTEVYKEKLETVLPGSMEVLDDLLPTADWAEFKY